MPVLHSPRALNAAVGLTLALAATAAHTPDDHRAFAAPNMALCTLSPTVPGILKMKPSPAVVVALAVHGVTAR